MTPLDRFLQRNSIKPAASLPLVHSAAAYTIRRIIQSKKIIAKTECNVFKGEKLNYFFVGRPAYKREYEVEGDYWELPACVILDYRSVSVKRIYPFDTGAFDMYPEFIRIMDRSDFETTNCYLQNAGVKRKRASAALACRVFCTVTVIGRRRNRKPYCSFSTFAGRSGYRPIL